MVSDNPLHLYLYWLYPYESGCYPNISMGTQWCWLHPAIAVLVGALRTSCLRVLRQDGGTDTGVAAEMKAGSVQVLK